LFDRERRFIGTHEFHRHLAGASKDGQGVGSAVFQEVAEELVRRRRQFKRLKLRWRSSRGASRSLAYKGSQVSFQGSSSYAHSAYKLGAGNIS
jgi:putative transposase